MKLLTALAHPVRMKRLYGALQALLANWRHQNTKYLEREYMIPIANALLIAVCQLFDFDLTAVEKSSIAAMTIAAVGGILLRKLTTGEFHTGWAKLQQREFTMPIFTELVILANKIFTLGLDEKTILYLAGSAAGGVVVLVTKKGVEARNGKGHSLSEPPALPPGNRGRSRT